MTHETMTELRDYLYLGTTQSLCPHCLRLVGAKIIARAGRVYFRKQCPEHGPIEEFVCSDLRWYDRHEFSEPAKVVREFATQSARGCPFDCGLCPEHEQHTCVGLAEITSSCNLTCPMCYAGSAPGGTHWSVADFEKVVEDFVRREGEPDVLQISGGEPTIHPEILRLVRLAYERPIQVVMINTNGIRLAQDLRLVAALATMRDRLEIYLQFDGFAERTYESLRGESLLDLKLRALENLAEHGLRSTLVATLENHNLEEAGAIVKFALDRPWVRGVSFQPATYVGRHPAPGRLERRVTLPDVVRALVAGTNGLFQDSDFLPVPCAHPNCHLMTWVYRGGGAPVPVARFLNLRENTDLLANTLVYTPEKARRIAGVYLERDCGGLCSCDPVADRFLASALGEKLTGAEVFRITLTAFLDRHIFDVRRVMKCCIAFLLPTGHAIPFCAYNTLYRDGHVPLPPLAR